ncbi:unnamed protein product [Hymenolepis diminuta]|nr:unnamed protein product [Hymenolepis diminuta]
MILEDLRLNLIPENVVFSAMEAEEMVTEVGFLKLFSPDDFSPINKFRNKGKQVKKEDCTIFTHSVIVLILKCQKSMTHAELLKNVKEEAKGRFQPATDDIKTGIEKLVQ